MLALILARRDAGNRTMLALILARRDVARRERENTREERCSLIRQG